MDKRDEIEMAIKEHVKACLAVSGEKPSETFAGSISKSLPVLLDGLGVVIKADRELPHYTGDEDYRGLLKSDIYLNAQDHMVKAGYAAFESLIKE